MSERKPILEYATPQTPRSQRALKLWVLVLAAIIFSAILTADMFKLFLGMLVWAVAFLFWIVDKMSQWQRPRL
jgi:hypothetical protein